MGQFRLGQETVVHPRLERPPIVATGSPAQPKTGFVSSRFPVLGQTKADAPELPPGTGIRAMHPGEIGRTASGQFYRLEPNGQVTNIPEPSMWKVENGKIVIAGGSVAPTTPGTSWWEEELVPGVPNKWLVGGAGGLFALLLGSRGRRR